MSRYLEESLKSGADYDQIIPINLLSYPELVKKLREQPQNNTISAGNALFDDVIGGFERERLYVLSAPTKQGKTTLAQTMMYHMAKKKIPSLFFSFEMGWQEVVGKYLAMDNKTVSEQPTDLPLFMPLELHRGGGDLQFQWLYEAILKGIEERGIQFVVIDHLHFLLPLKDFKNTSFIIGGIVREIKRIAVNLKIPIMLIAHVQKIKDDKVPDWTDIRDSSFITQEADVVLMMYRKKNKEAARKIQDDSTIQVYSKVAMLSLELDRVKGQSKKIKLWHNGVMFEEYRDQDKTDAEEIANNINVYARDTRKH